MQRLIKAARRDKGGVAFAPDKKARGSGLLDKVHNVKQAVKHPTGGRFKKWIGGSDPKKRDDIFADEEGLAPLASWWTGDAAEALAGMEFPKSDTSSDESDTDGNVVFDVPCNPTKNDGVDLAVLDEQLFMEQKHKSFDKPKKKVPADASSEKQVAEVSEAPRDPWADSGDDKPVRKVNCPNAPVKDPWADSDEETAVPSPQNSKPMVSAANGKTAAAADPWADSDDEGDRGTPPLAPAKGAATAQPLPAPPNSKASKSGEPPAPGEASQKSKKGKGAKKEKAASAEKASLNSGSSAPNEAPQKSRKGSGTKKDKSDGTVPATSTREARAAATKANAVASPTAEAAPISEPPVVQAPSVRWPAAEESSDDDDEVRF